eukprot:PhF_6_TR29218/c0_g1_i1/m.42751
MPPNNGWIPFLFLCLLPTSSSQYISPAAFVELQVLDDAIRDENVWMDKVAMLLNIRAARLAMYSKTAYTKGTTATRLRIVGPETLDEDPSDIVADRLLRDSRDDPYTALGIVTVYTLSSEFESTRVQKIETSKEDTNTTNMGIAISVLCGVFALWGLIIIVHNRVRRMMSRQRKALQRNPDDLHELEEQLLNTEDRKHKEVEEIERRTRDRDIVLHKLEDAFVKLKEENEALMFRIYNTFNQPHPAESIQHTPAADNNTSYTSRSLFSPHINRVDAIRENLIQEIKNKYDVVAKPEGEDGAIMIISDSREGGAELEAYRFPPSQTVPVVTSSPFATSYAEFPDES